MMTQRRWALAFQMRPIMPKLDFREAACYEARIPEAVDLRLV
jgi:hypothetical protein